MSCAATIIKIFMGRGYSKHHSLIGNHYMCQVALTANNMCHRDTIMISYEFVREYRAVFVRIYDFLLGFMSKYKPYCCRVISWYAASSQMKAHDRRCKRLYCLRSEQSIRTVEVLKLLAPVRTWLSVRAGYSEESRGH